MNYKRYEAKIFDDALSAMEYSERRIAEYYIAKREAVLDRIKAYSFDTEKNGFKLARMNSLYTNLDNKINELIKKTTTEVAGGFKEVRLETYYKTAYNINNEINISLVESPVRIDFVLMNNKAIEAALSDRIGGHTFLDKIEDHRAKLRYNLQGEVANAIIDGIGAGEFARRLRNIDNTFEMSKARAQSTARTELLRAYSEGAEEATREAESAGVEFKYVWESTLDANTRQSHQRADGQVAIIIHGVPAFSINGVLLSSPRITHPDNIKYAAGEIVNCRCRRSNRPFGISPSFRAAKDSKGEWSDVRSDIKYQEWKDKYF